MRRILGSITALLAVVAASAAVGTPPAAALPARTLELPVSSTESGIVGAYAQSRLIRAWVRVPRGGRIWRIPEEEAAGLVVRRGACTARIALGAQLDRPTRRADLPSRQRVRATVTGSNGATHRAVAWGSGALAYHPSRRRGAEPRADGGLRAAVATVRLPAIVLHRMPYRELSVFAQQASAGKHCTRATWDASLVAALHRVQLRVIGTYPPDNPAPVLDADALEHLTIAGTGTNAFFGDQVTSVGDTDGDGRPELATTYGQSAGVGTWVSTELRLVNVGPLSGSVSIADPAVTTLTVRGIDDRTPVQPAGDVDGDGRADLLVPLLSRYHVDGSVAVVRGRPAGGVVDLGDPSAASLTVLAAPRGPGDGEGEGPDVDAAVAPGDVDGDGHPDLVVTATANPGPTPVRPGTERVWLVSGADQPGTVVLGESPRTRVIAQLPPHASRTGLVALGDVDGDGLADIGTAGAIDDRASWAGVLFSSTTDREPVRLDAPGPRGIVVRSDTCADLSVDGPVGDVNGDGHADLIVDASEECGGDVPLGAVLFGSATPGQLTPAQIAPTGRGLTVDTQVAPAGGDRNGDGLADLLVNDGESAYVVFGHAAPVAIELRRLGAGGQHVTLTLGQRVTLIDALVAVPDADGDGRPELAFGSQHATVDGRPEQGAVFVLGSRAGAAPTSPPSAAPRRGG